MKIQEKKVGVVDPDFPQKRLEFPRKSIYHLIFPISPHRLHFSANITISPRKKVNITVSQSPGGPINAWKKQRSKIHCMLRNFLMTCVWTQLYVHDFTGNSEKIDRRYLMISLKMNMKILYNKPRRIIRIYFPQLHPSLTTTRRHPHIWSDVHHLRQSNEQADFEHDIQLDNWCFCPIVVHLYEIIIYNFPSISRIT